MLKTSTVSNSRSLNVFSAFRWQYWLAKLPFNKIEKGQLNLTVMQHSFQFVGSQQGHHAELVLVKPWRALWLIYSQGELGFSQAYFEGALETDSLYRVMSLFYDNRQVFSAMIQSKSLSFWQLFKHRSRHNSKANSKKNISYHYDLGNDFYQLWLDKTMSYSSAYYEYQSQSFEQAQQAKYDRIADQLNLKPSDRVLEIGCGWGGMMQTLLNRGCYVKGLTLSKEQQFYSQARLVAYDDFHYKVAYQDYRDEHQQYDHIVSIEMFEAVGKEYWNNYFQVLKRCLKIDGRAVLQVITINDEFAEEYQNGVDFIQAYIFPGGLLPSFPQLNDLAQQHGFKITNSVDFGADYGKTCQIWKQNFNRHKTQLEAMGYDHEFQKMWNYYLDYCTVGFENQHISVVQVTLQQELSHE